MLTIDNLSVSYGTHTVLSQLDLSLERGDAVLALLDKLKTENGEPDAAKDA